MKFKDRDSESTTNSNLKLDAQTVFENVEIAVEGKTWKIKKTYDL